MKSKLTVLSCCCALLVAREFRATLAGHPLILPPPAFPARASKSNPRHRDRRQYDVRRGWQLPGAVPQPRQPPVTVEKPGFRRLVRDGISLGVSERAVLDLSLTLGDVSQSISVTADTALLQTESADRGLSIENNRVETHRCKGATSSRRPWSLPASRSVPACSGCGCSTSPDPPAWPSAAASPAATKC
jgi:hypothetical protein